MSENWNAIRESLSSVFQGNSLWILFVISLIYLFFADRKRRRLIVYPTLILLAIVLEPHMYGLLWQKVVSYAYWRTFWLFPVLPVIAYAAIRFVSRAGRKIVRLALLVVLFLAVALCGSFVYNGAGTGFRDRQNWFKLPNEVPIIGAILLDQEDSPRVVVENELYSYIRQYSSDIRLMYGRNADGFISSLDAKKKKVAETLESEKPDLDLVRDVMKEYGYNYLVKSYVTEDQLSEYAARGFSLIEQVASYGIFRLE